MLNSSELIAAKTRLIAMFAASSFCIIACAGPVCAVTPESKAHTKKGIELVNQGKSKEAVEEFKKAIELDPTNSDYHRNLSAVYQSLNMLPEAQKEAEAAVKNKAGDARNLYQLGTVLTAQKKYADAEKQYRKAIKIAPKSAEYHASLCVCLESQDKKAELESEVKEELKTNPKNVEALAHLSKCQLAKKNKEDAEKTARQAVDCGPKSFEAHLALATVLQARGKDKEAVKEYEAALSIKPDHPSAKQIKDSISYIKNKVDSRIP